MKLRAASNHTAKYGVDRSIAIYLWSSGECPHLPIHLCTASARMGYECAIPGFTAYLIPNASFLPLLVLVHV